MTFTQDNASFDKNNNLSKVKKDISTIQSEVAELSEEISSIDNDLQDYKQTVANEQSSQNSQINANLQSLNNLQQYTENYVEQNKELIETQVLRASEYVESPLHRIVETDTILENQIFGDELKTKKVIINHQCSKKYIDIKKIPKGIVSFNNGALKLLIDTTFITSSGHEITEIIEIDNSLLSPAIYATQYNSVFSYKMQEYATEYNCLYFIMQDNSGFPLIIDYVIVEGTTYSREQFLENITESNEPIHESTSSFTVIENGYHNLHGYIFDKNGKIDTDIHTATEEKSIGGASTLARYTFNYCTKGDIHTIGGSIVTLQSVSSGATFYGSLTDLCYKAQIQLIQNLDLLIPIYKDSSVVAYLHIETPSGLSDGGLTYKATILGDLSSGYTYYIGQTTFLA